MISEWLAYELGKSAARRRARRSQPHRPLTVDDVAVGRLVALIFFILALAVVISTLL